MEILITMSLVLNIAVLLPVCGGLIKDANWVRRAYGGDSPARGILLSVYLSIGIVSSVLLLRTVPEAVAALLLVQIVYKLTTPITVRSLKNPVVVSNLFIAAIHSVTIIAIWSRCAQTG